MTWTGRSRLLALFGAGALVAAAALIAVWITSASQVDFGGPLTPRAFTLGGERFEMKLPEQAKVSGASGAAYVWIEIRPGARAPASIWLETPYDDSQPFAFDQKRNLDGGVVVEYRVSVNEVDAGSGGPEANLDGRLSFNGRQWSVACVVQREGVLASEAEWCLALLGGLRAAPAE